MKIGLIAVSGWLVAAVLTVGISWSAISVVRTSVVPQAPVNSTLPTPDEAVVTTAPATPRPTPKPTAGTMVTVAGQGGQIIVRCVNAKPDVLNIHPASGFTAQVDDSGREVQLVSAAGHRTELKVGCTGNTVTSSVDEHAATATGGGGGGGDDNGGGRGRGGGGSGGGGGGGDN
ncbi:MAG TPA: hypothetical protein VGP36_08295 [Mycobacteriales bacterium]|nr:hypothetical protein [Mycobacteriales bacterium]